MNLYFDKNSIQSVDAAIQKYSAGEFRSPTRSTVPLLSWLKHEQSTVFDLLEDLGLPTDCNLHLEYRVKSMRGSGQASHTDLMVISGGAAIAVEAKWTEQRYEAVDKWKKKGSSLQNRSEVLTGWLDLLQGQTQHDLRVEDFTDTIYQMVHRAASACAAGDRNAKMAYLVFKPSPSPHTADTKTILADLEHLWHILGCPSTFPFYLIEVNMSTLPAFEAIKSLKKREKETARRVTGALLGSEPLFSFEKYRLTRVGDDS